MRARMWFALAAMVAASNTFAFPLATAQPPAPETPEIDVVMSGVAVPLYESGERTYVEARKGREYAILVKNPWDRRLAVAVSVDGLNSIDAKHTTAEGASKWVIPAHGEIVVRGWQVSKRRLRQFVFTTEAQSYGASLGHTSDLGNISVVGFFEHDPEVVQRDRPYGMPSGDEFAAGGADRSRAKAGPAAAAPSPSRAKAPAQADGELAATKQGRSVRHEIGVVSMRLETTPAFSRVIRYEFRDALVRLGVVPETSVAARLRERENAQGFESMPFAPEQ